MRVLVTAASRHGSTREIGARIGAMIGACGHTVDVRRPADVEEVERYDVIVLGSAVYAGHWRKEARDLAMREHDVLARRPVWLFSSGPVGDPAAHEEPPADGDQIRAAIGAFEHHLFTGRIDPDAHALPAGAVVRTMHVLDADDRDWDEVDRWAATIAASISTG